MRKLAVSLLIIGSANTASSEPHEHIRLDTSATFSRIEQQVKTKVGGPRGERLVEDTEVGTYVAATYELGQYFAVGLFGQFDIGARRAGRFAGFDGSGQTALVDRSGGRFSELWLGPLVRGKYRFAFLELGYGIATFRKDRGRDDLPSESGNSSSAFRTLPAVSWSMSIGAQFPVTQTLDVSARLNWRIRYYDRRNSGPLLDDIVYGTQSYQPSLGIVWYPGR